MAKFIFTYFLEFVIGLIFLTQILIPIFVKKLKFFWLFRNSDAPQNSDLDELKKKAEQNVEDRNNIKNQTSDIKNTINDIENLTK